MVLCYRLVYREQFRIPSLAEMKSKLLLRLSSGHAFIPINLRILLREFLHSTEIKQCNGMINNYEKRRILMSQKSVFYRIISFCCDIVSCCEKKVLHWFVKHF